jgi:flagellar protein FlaJ
MRVRFMLFTIEQANSLPSNIRGFGNRLARFIPSLGETLRYAHLNVDSGTYLAASIISALGYGIIFAVVFGLIGLIGPDGGVGNAIKLGISTGVITSLAAGGLHVVYPHILAQQATSGVDQGLVFALKSLLIQVSSGVGLYDAMNNVAKSNYGSISTEFGVVVQEINAGMTEVNALERLALRTESEFLRKTVWQMVTGIRSGSSVAIALQNMVDTLTDFQKRTIKNYAAELNMWILIYLLVAAAMPTIGITFIVILSSIGGTDVSEGTIFLAVGAAFLIQFILVGLVRTRAPAGYA